MFSRLASAARGGARRAAAVAPRSLARPTTWRVATRSMASSAPQPQHTIVVGGYPTIPGTFGEDSFNARAMKRCLSKGVYEEIQDCIQNRRPISLKLANHFAQGLMRCVLCPWLPSVAPAPCNVGA